MDWASAAPYDSQRNGAHAVSEVRAWAVFQTVPFAFFKPLVIHPTFCFFTGDCPAINIRSGTTEGTWSGRREHGGDVHIAGLNASGPIAMIATIDRLSVVDWNLHWGLKGCQWKQQGLHAPPPGISRPLGSQPPLPLGSPFVRHVI